MQLIAPDVLAEARGLTPAAAGTLCAVGLALFLFGWRWHRFWVVAGVTFSAGLLGLNAGQAAGGARIMAGGVLVAVAAGMMALELAKVFAFVAGGCGAFLAVQWVVPQAQELWAVFLSGGLLGLLLYRPWTMLLTSLAGVLLAAHAGLLLLEPLLRFDAAAWADAHQAAANGVAVGLTVLGILIQALYSPDRAKPEAEPAEKPARKPKPPADEEPEEEPEPAKPAGWWRRLFPFRKAA
ncbi:MAG: hypothetical protein C0501_15155 [Isosphaera sp.]|nr:hypothetical protein [Isosphaera sp.]